jgi:hypothetical protein
MWQQVELALSQSAHRVLFKLASFLPALLALILAIIILTAVGAGLAAILRRILTAAKFDERIARNSGGWAPSQSPTDLFARTAFWACVILGVFIGISAFDAAYPGETEISLLILPYLTHSVGAIILLIVGTILARFLGRSVLISSVNAKLQYARVLSLGVKWLVLVLTAAMVLDHLQIGGTIVDLAFGILFGGIVFTLSLAVGLGSRDIVSRSLKKDTLDPFPPDPDYKPHTPTETLRHF